MLHDKERLRLSIRGRSMQPSISEPMLLQIGPPAKARVGDVVVFANGGVLVAHRVVGMTASAFVTAGDAQPHIVESVLPEQIVGRVAAIWSDASPTARRVDGCLHRLRGWYYAHLHGLRRVRRDFLEKGRDLAARAQPRRRPRVAGRLVEAIAAMQCGDATALVAAIGSDAEAIERIDKRHRCAALLGEGVRRLGLTERLSPDVAARLRRARLHAVYGAGKMDEAVHRTVKALREANIEFALLKGAARIYGSKPESAYHSSDDVDVLVRGCDVDRAVTALRARGWEFRDAPNDVRRMRARHHHAASLFSPVGDFPVEIHHELAEPGSLSLETGWDALRGHLVPLDGAAGGVLQLDRYATTLHLAIHAIGLTRLRDVALLASMLRTLSRDELAALKKTVHAERRDFVRLDASVALAARISRIPWSTSSDVASYITWALRREDLPKRLRLRSGAAEAYFARPWAPWTTLRHLVPWWSRGTQIAVLPVRIIARCASNALALAYATQMKERRSLLS